MPGVARLVHCCWSAIYYAAFIGICRLLAQILVVFINVADHEHSKDEAHEEKTIALHRETLKTLI